jgi:hypothetical protein
MSEERLSDELAAVEAALSSLTPVASNIQRDRVLFLAGLASADRVSLPRRRRLADWLWPCATSASLLLAAAFTTLWAVGGKQEFVERVVYVSVERPATVPSERTVRRPSPAFANWQPAPLARRKTIDASPRPNTTPSRRTERNSESGGRLNVVRSIT